MNLYLIRRDTGAREDFWVRGASFVRADAIRLLHNDILQWIGKGPEAQVYIQEDDGADNYVVSNTPKGSITFFLEVLDVEGFELMEDEDGEEEVL